MLKEKIVAFSELISKKRKELGMTQEQVAQLLHVNRQAVSNWERGKNYPDLDVLIELSRAYDLSLDLLIKGDVGILKKVKEDAQELRRQRKIRKLEFSLLTVTLLLIVIPVSFNLFKVHNIWNSHLINALLFVLVMFVMIASWVLYRFIYPGPINKNAPIFVPKQIGIGLTINPQNPIGLIIWILLMIVLIIIFVPRIF
ncbi:helix-turn-helix domain-containing protein [Oenococcus kitaharae]|uniref:helix-turn-helix domain-containing protein n=1 Tax=Oenococcus kitaharae TaxID=336988 RepID=UPI000481683B|nr:XRE family transcriptional regulator [Oenococcus kitaharae]OEY83911.1 XRE family transcriptional regulator [Oenococcus kitaharae]OEY84187.1 XRE family transcriptional regulator [Oenococcus kitaharae]